MVATLEQVFREERGRVLATLMSGCVNVTRPEGYVVHLEIPSDDPAKGSEFYGSLFGWEFQDVPGPFTYRMANVDDKHGVAITGMEPGKRGPRVYFDVEDINVGTSRVKELGGTAGKTGPLPGMGWFAVCTDPEGNEFGLWQSDTSAAGPTE